MEDNNTLQHARAAFRIGASVDALKYCEILLSHDNADIAALRLKANVLNTYGDCSEAIRILGEILTISAGREEPCDYFYRGRWLLADGELSLSIADFSALLIMEKRGGRPYYSEDALLHRAYAYHRLGRVQDAVADLRAIGEDDCVTNIGGEMVSKRTLLALVSQPGA